MKRMLVALILGLLCTSVSFAIEPYAATAGYAAHAGYSTTAGGVDGTASAIAAGDYLNDVKVSSAIYATSAGSAATASAVVASSGVVSLIDSGMNTLSYGMLYASLTMGSTAYLTKADGKAGAFEISIGTFSASGSFSTTAAISLSSNNSGMVSSTAGALNSLIIFDGGTVVGIENETGATIAPIIRYWYKN
jgi:hypothetical protein